MYDGKKLFESAVNDTVVSMINPFYAVIGIPSLITYLSIIVTSVSKNEMSRRLKKISDAYITARETYAIPDKYGEYGQFDKRKSLYRVDDDGSVYFNIPIHFDDKCEQWLIETVKQGIDGKKLVSKSRSDFKDYFENFYTEMIEVIKEESPIRFVKVR